MVFGAISAVFYYEAPGNGVVYAGHGGPGSDFMASIVNKFPRDRAGFMSSLAAFREQKIACGNGGAEGILSGIGSFIPPLPPPPPPPSFGVSAGGGGTNGSGGVSNGGDSGATTGGSGTSGTGASSITINEGGAVTMSFACVNSTSSSGLNFSTGGAAEGSVSINPLDSTTFTVVCSNGGRSSVEVTVLHPVLEITADPIQIRSGRESLITWSATNVDSCNVTGTNGFFATGLSGSQPSNPIILQSIFTLTCENIAGTLSKNVTVYLIPEFREF